MAKVKLANVDPRAFIEARGRLMLSDTKHGAVVSKWPRKRGPATSGYDFYRQREFAVAAKWAANPLDLDLGTAVEMAKGTEQVPRDILMMCIFGLYYEIIMPDGTVMEPARMTTNAQYILDQVTNVPGSMLYRAEIGWVGLPPGPAGSFLTSNGRNVYWGGGSGGGGGYQYVANSWLSASSGDNASRGARLRPVLPFSIRHVTAPVPMTEGGVWQWSLWLISAGDMLLEELAVTEEFTAPATETITRLFTFTTPPVLFPPNWYCLLLTRRDATDTTPVYTPTTSGHPVNFPVDDVDRSLTYATKDPQPGMSPVSTSATGVGYGLTYRIEG